MSASKKLTSSLILFVLGIAGLVISTILAVYFAPLSSLGLFLVIGGFLASFLTAKLGIDRRDKLVTSLHTGTFEFQKEVGRSFSPDKEILKSISRTQEEVRPLEGEGAINLYHIYSNLFRDITIRTHGYLDKIPINTRGGILDALATHLKNCPDCQRLLRYVATEMQKLLPVEVENEEVEA